MTQPPDQQPDAGSGVPLPPGWGATSGEGDPQQTMAFPPLGQMPQPPKKRNTALIITAVVLGVTLLLCAAGGVGAFLLLQNSEGKGAASAKAAADDFLTAVYKDGDAETAEALVCREARDTKAIKEKINEVQAQKDKLKVPRITWETPKIENETPETAETVVTVRLTTSDEKVSAQTLRLSLVQRDGWFVCEIQEQKQ